MEEAVVSVAMGKVGGAGAAGGLSFMLSLVAAGVVLSTREVVGIASVAMGWFGGVSTEDVVVLVAMGRVGGAGAAGGLSFVLSLVTAGVAFPTRGMDTVTYEKRMPKCQNKSGKFRINSCNTPP
jgi:glycerate kinase